MNKFTRELGATNLIAAYGYEGEEVVHNDFDSKYPWSDIEKIVDDNNNTWVRIPKFYTKYETDENGYITKRYISQYNIDSNWHLNPIFLNEDGNEIPYVDIAAYQLTIDENNMARSVSGKSPSIYQNLADIRNMVKEYNDLDSNYNYNLFNIWTSILEQDLFLVEFAQLDVNINTNRDENQPILRGYGSSFYTKEMLKTGKTDNISSPSGVLNEELNKLYKSPMKYRNIENMIGNGRQYIDGIAISDGVITVTDSYGEKVSSLVLPGSQGQVHKLGFDRETKLVFPTVTATTGSYGDQYLGNKNGSYILTRGWGSDSGNGLFTYNFASSTKGYYTTFRMIRTPR